MHVALGTKQRIDDKMFEGQPPFCHQSETPAGIFDAGGSASKTEKSRKQPARAELVGLPRTGTPPRAVPAMHLYHLTALPPSGGSLVANGSFSAPRAQEVVLASGSRLSLHRLTKAGALAAMATGEAFGALRALAPFRLTGARRDLLLVTSDAGSLAVLEFDAAARVFRNVAMDVFGRSGCRRVVPGEYLVVDPKGRACMVGAVERGKFAYVLARGAEGEVSMQSALEAHKSGVAVHAMVGLDVGFENPMFAALERAYEGEGSAEKRLVYYELDLGLNHVVRRFASAVDAESLVMLAVPGGGDGPGGVLVCSPGRVSYRNLVEEEDAKEGAVVRIDVEIPRRVVDEVGVGGAMVVCGAVHKHRDVFFFVLCSEHGDLFKVEIDWSETAGAVEMRVLYFDSLPVPARALAIFRSGYLFAALESGDPMFMKFKATNVAEGDGGYSSNVGALEYVKRLRRERGGGKCGEGEADGGDAMIDVEGGGNEAKAAADVAEIEAEARLAAPEIERRREFSARDQMRYFTVVDVLESFAPGIAIACGDFCGEGSSQLVCASGRGREANLRILRRGFAVLELMAQNMVATINGIFTLREKSDDLHDRFIVVSFRDATKVLRVNNDSVVEFHESGLFAGSATLGVGQVGQSSLLQVFAAGIRFVPSGRPDAAVEWTPAPGVTVLSASINSAQAIVALSSGSVIYFDLSAAAEGDNLEQPLKPTETLPDAVGAVSAAAMDGTISFPPALALADVPKGRTRAPFFAVADGQSSMVRLYQVVADGEVKSVGVHMAPAPVDSLALVDFGALSGDALASAEMAVVSKKASKSSADASVSGPIPVESVMCLAVGTRKGALVLLRVDQMTGAMSGKRTKFLGPRTVRMERMTMAGVPCCFAMSLRPWLMHRQGARVATSPLCTEAMSHVASFSSELFPDGFVAASGSTLRFLSLESLPALTASATLPARLPASLVPADTALGSTFFMSKSKLVCTPRRIAPVGHHAFSTAQDKGASTHGLFVLLETEHRGALQYAGDGKAAAKHRRTVGSAMALTSAGPGLWASQIRLISIKQTEAEDGQGEEDDLIDKDSADEDEEELYAKAATTLDCVPLPDCDACALALTTTSTFGDATAANPYVVVSVGRNVVMSATSPRAAWDLANSGKDESAVAPSGELHVYRVNTSSQKLELVHITLVDKPVHAMVSFRNMVLVGIGKSLRLYALGKKQLLRKSETRMVVANQICALATAGGDRVFVGDVRESVTLFRYCPPSMLSAGAGVLPQTNANALNSQGGRFAAVARDVLPRYVTNLLTLDYSTVCGSDKFGNVFVLRLPVELSGAELSGLQVGSGKNSTGYRLAVEACFHVGSTVTGLALGSLRGGTGAAGHSSQDAECIIYSTLGGAIGILAPFVGKSDADLATEIEAQMRIHYPSLIGRSHVSYRSSFAPVRHIVDGDLCEMFLGLSRESQVAIAVKLERELPDLLRKVDDFRNNIL
jgi:splicing factor 3B subunit 3